MKRPVAKRRGPPKGHPPWGTRPRGVEMPCGWGCGANLTAREMRNHFTTCPNKPEYIPKKKLEELQKSEVDALSADKPSASTHPR